MLGQRYAYDLTKTDERAGSHVHPAGSLRWFMFGGRTRDCYGWGEPVHAALGGEVVDAVDGVSHALSLTTSCNAMAVGSPWRTEFHTDSSGCAGPYRSTGALGDRPAIATGPPGACHARQRRRWS